MYIIVVQPSHGLVVVKALALNLHPLSKQSTQGVLFFQLLLTLIDLASE